MSVSQRLESVFSGIMAVCAIGALYTYVARGGTPSPPSTKPVEEHDWQRYSVVGPRFGAEHPRVTITEFSDFQCPFCKRLKSTLDTLLERYPKDLAVVYRHFPISSIHANARSAALASACADDQQRFHSFHDVLYTRPDSIGKVSWKEYASRAAIPDESRFLSCIRDSVRLDVVRRDSIDGQQLKVTGTPTVMVNKWRMRGPMTVGTIEELVLKELGK